MNEVMENQRDAHPTQINRVATRRSSKTSFIFLRSSGIYEVRFDSKSEGSFVGTKVYRSLGQEN